MMLERTVTMVVACKVIAKSAREAEVIAGKALLDGVKQPEGMQDNKLQEVVLEAKVIGRAAFYFDPFTTEPMVEED